MFFRGKLIDPIRLWSEYCEIQEDDGPFLPLTYCPNPDHDNSRTPAFQVNVEQPTVHCFSYCGISGSYEHAICVIHDLYTKFHVFEARDERAQRARKRKAYREARRIIRGHSRVAVTKDAEIPRRRSKKSRRASPNGISGEVGESLDIASYSYLPPVALDYLNSRGLSSDVISAFELGWDREKLRIVVPARDERERIVGLIRRAVRPQDHPKYLYTEGFDRNSLLFGACQIDLGLVRSDGLVLVEGSFDVMRLRSLGIGNVCGTLGSYVSQRQAEIIARLHPSRIYLMRDKDLAGIRGIIAARDRLKKYPLYVCRFPRGKSDPGELTRKEAYRSLENALPMLKFLRILPDAVTRKEQAVG